VLIGELSRLTGVNAHQLRYYESQGLLEPARSANGYRHYSNDAVLTVTQIRKLLDAGLSTQDIHDMLPCATGTRPDLAPCPDLLDTLRVRLSEVDAHIATLVRSRHALSDYIEATESRLSETSEEPRPEPTSNTRAHSPLESAAV
jgi:DNA-binding transcriptional MerR regulator